MAYIIIGGETHDRSKLRSQNKLYRSCCYSKPYNRRYNRLSCNHSGNHCYSCFSVGAFGNSRCIPRCTAYCINHFSCDRHTMLHMPYRPRSADGNPRYNSCIGSSFRNNLCRNKHNRHNNNSSTSHILLADGYSNRLPD